MCRKHGKRRGISAIVGGIIILAIFFATIIPLMLLMQNSYTIFLQESNSRRIFDTDRASESLTVEASQSKATKDLVLILSNDGPVYVKPVRAWAINVAKQTSLTGNAPCLGVGLEGLPPGRNTTLNVRQCVSGFTGIAQFIVVSEKGRLFASNRVNLTGGQLVDIVFPYTLTVSILNMKRGTTYEARVEILGEGNITPSTFTHKATASNENVTIAFGAAAGRYKISLYENNVLAKVKDNPVTITIPDTSAIIFDLGRVPYQPVTLDIIFDVPRKVFVVQGEEESFSAGIWVQLPKEVLEPVKDFDVDVGKIQVTGAPQLSKDIVCTPFSGFTLQPGQRTIAALCTITIKGPEGKYSLAITIDEDAIIGEGFYSGLPYKNDEKTTTVDVQIRKK